MNKHAGRNESCPCGSGRKFKHCCEGKGASPNPLPDECNWLIVLFNAGQYAELERAARLLLVKSANSGFCWKALGLALQAQGKNAVASFEQAVTLAPTDPDAHFQLGNALKKSGRPADAVICFSRSIELNPGYVLAHNNLGNTLREMGRLDEAANSYGRALVLNPDIAEIHNNMGRVQHDMGRFADAIASFRRALALNPGYALACCNLGDAYEATGQLVEAATSFEKALEITPSDAEVYYRLGNVLRKQCRFEDAARCYRKAIELQPRFAEAHNDLGAVLEDLGKLDDAAESFRNALAIQPDFVDALYNLGTVLRVRGKWEEAMGIYRKVLALKPDDADTHNNFAHLLLALGEWRQGFVEYEWRDSRGDAGLVCPTVSSLLPFDAVGKRILLCHEQGIGDEIFFLRFAGQLRAWAQWLGYFSTPKPHTLIERSSCVERVFSKQDELPVVDLIIPVGDLPLLLGCHVKTDIPPPLRFSTAPQQLANVRERLAELGLAGQRLLGVTWRAGTPTKPGKQKTLFKQMNLGLLIDAIKDWGGAILILQRNPEPEEIVKLRAGVSCPVHDFSGYNDDLESMLALLDVLDEYVGVSNTNMHLMAGLNKTARVLIPSPSEWRWMEGVNESPWFPGFVLYRQGEAGDWDSALATLARDLLRQE